MLMPCRGASLSQDRGDSGSALPPPKKPKVEEDNSSVPMSQDSVENVNEKELKGGEEDNSSVPISQDSDERKAFKRWCALYGKEYTDESEREKRFNCFKDSLNRKVNYGLLHLGLNVPHYADLDEQEFNALYSFAAPVYCLITFELLNELEKFDAETDWMGFKIESG